MLACLSAGKKLQLGMREINVFTPKVMCSLQRPSYTVSLCVFECVCVCVCVYLQALGRQSAGVGHISVQASVHPSQQRLRISDVLQVSGCPQVYHFHGLAHILNLTHTHTHTQRFFFSLLVVFVSDKNRKTTSVP